MGKRYLAFKSNVRNPDIRVVEQRFELQGITYELASLEGLPAREVYGPYKHHLLTLALSPLPKHWEAHFLTQELSARIGTLNFLPAGSQYRMTRRIGRHRWLTMAIDPNYFHERTGYTQDTHPTARVDVRGTPIDGALFRVARELASPEYASSQLIDALSQGVLVDLIRLLRGNAQQSPAAEEGLSAQQLTKIREYVEGSDFISPTVQDIAKLVGISRRHLTRMFKTSTGQTIHSYVAEFRLRKAINLLASTEMSVKEISNKIGFASPWGLSSAFRDATGQTPTQFRRSYRAS